MDTQCDDCIYYIHKVILCDHCNRFLCEGCVEYINEKKLCYHCVFYLAMELVMDLRKPIAKL